MSIGWIPACAGMTAGWGINVISDIYVSIAEKITGEKHHLSDNPKGEIIEILDKNFSLII